VTYETSVRCLDVQHDAELGRPVDGGGVKHDEIEDPRGPGGYECWVDRRVLETRAVLTFRNLHLRTWVEPRTYSHLGEWGVQDFLMLLVARFDTGGSNATITIRSHVVL